MNDQPWFERHWDFDSIPESYEATLGRLADVPRKLRAITAELPLDVLVYRPLGKWSIKEHIGHLCLLEPLWRIRFQEIQDVRPEMTGADLGNKATTEARFSDKLIDHLLGTFSEERSRTMQLLESIGAPDNTKRSRHPRLQQFLRIIDLAYFVAEHDVHHTERIREIIKMLEKDNRETVSIDSFLDYLQRIRERTNKIIRVIPKDQLDYTYLPGRFSIGDQVRHIAAIERYLFAETVAGRKNAYPGCGKELADGYENVVGFFDDLHRQSLDIFSRLQDHDLLAQCRTPGNTEITVWKWLRVMVEHEIHHRGQLYLYLNMLGVPTPPIFGMTSEQLLPDGRIFTQTTSA